MAEDVLAMALYDYEKEEETIPKPSNRTDIKLQEGEFINDIVADSYCSHPDQIIEDHTRKHWN